MKTQPKLETERLILRPFDLSDAKRVQLLAGDETIASTTLAIPHPYEDGMAEAWIRTHPEAYEKGESISFAIIMKSSGELLGAIGLTLHQEHVHAELGYWVGKPYWDRGYCTEAARAVLEYGFRQLFLHKITSSHFTRNPSSGRVMRKIGMKKEGVFKEHVVKGDEYEDLVIYGILRKEWEEGNEYR